MNLPFPSALLLLLFLGLPAAAAGAEIAGIEAFAPRRAVVPLSEQFTVYSKRLGRAYDISVRLPPGYDRPANLLRRYPVVYFNDSPYSFPLITGVAHLPMGNGGIEELILVGIGYARGTTSGLSRQLDYTPTHNPAFRDPTGGAAQYLQFLERELLPAIERRYRADPGRRGLAGHSFGGLFAAHVLLTRPELFRYYILSSPSFWFHDRSLWAIERAYAAAHRDLPVSVYVGIGGLERPPRGSRYDMVKDVETFDAVLRSREFPGLRLRTKIVPGATHETVVGQVMLNGLLWHFARDRSIRYDY